MGILSSAEIAGFRALEASLLYHDTYAVIRATNTDDGAGGATTTEATVESGGCDLTAIPRLPRELSAGGRIESDSNYYVTLSAASIVTASDRLVINGTRRFEVVGIDRDGFLAIDTRAVCREIF